MTHDQILELTDHGLLELTDDELIDQADRVAATARASTVELIRLIIEVERRRLHLALGHASLFVFCTSRLKLSEAAAYGRITAARTARRFPVVLDMLTEGSLTLSGLGRLAAHLVEANVAQLLDAVRFKTTREVERIVATGIVTSIDARRSARPDVRPSLRAMPAAPVPVPARGALATAPDLFARNADAGLPERSPANAPIPGELSAHVVAGDIADVARSAPERHLLKVAISGQTRQKLEQLRALLRHQIPNGDIAEILDRALTVLLDQTVRARCAEVRSPSSRQRGGTSHNQARMTATAPGRSRRKPSRGSRSRHIAAEVRRAVWKRDQGRCAFVGADGRCGETGFIEIHHVRPFAAGGPSTVENLELRCRAHNAFELSLIDSAWQSQLNSARAELINSREHRGSVTVEAGESASCDAVCAPSETGANP